MNPLTWIGAGLSALAFLVLVMVLVDCLSPRKPLAAFGLAGSWASPGTVRWTWAALLLGAFVLGHWGTPILSEDTREEPGARAGGVPAGTVETSVRLPAYLHEATEVRTEDGTVLERQEVMTLQLPWPFVLGLVFYWALGVRPARRKGEGSERRESTADPPGP